MIKADELRLVSWVASNKHNGLYTQIFSILESKSIKLGANPIAVYSTDDIIGIPITEELLLKAGFEQGGYDFLFWYIDEMEFSGINWADKDEPDYQFINFSINEDKIISIHYIHQLQNLYFSLTGKELNIKL